MILGVDHIVYVVPDLEEGMNLIEEKFGIRPVYGGQHKNQGTHNALLNLHRGAYLEILAVDKSNTSVKPPRWMGVDLIQEPMVTRWAVRSDNIKADIQLFNKLGFPTGKLIAGSRKKSDGTTLSWEMTSPSFEPKVDLVPFIVDWKDSVHPTASLPEACVLADFSASHPQALMMKSIFKQLNIPIFPSFIKQSEAQTISISLNSPEGVIEL